MLGVQDKDLTEEGFSEEVAPEPNLYAPARAGQKKEGATRRGSLLQAGGGQVMGRRGSQIARAGGLRKRPWVSQEKPQPCQPRGRQRRTSAASVLRSKRVKGRGQFNKPAGLAAKQGGGPRVCRNREARRGESEREGGGSHLGAEPAPE